MRVKAVEIVIVSLETIVSVVDHVEANSNI